MPEHPARAAYSARTQGLQAAFLAAYSKAGTVTAACAAVPGGLSLQAVRNWDQGDVLGFSAAYADAREAWADYLEDLAYKRVANPEGSKGSDILLIALLNAHKPAKYRQQAVQLEVGPRVLDALRAAQARDSAQGVELDGPGVVDGSARELGPGVE
jgi:hypothetical protein